MADQFKRTEVFATDDELHVIREMSEKVQRVFPSGPFGFSGMSAQQDGQKRAEYVHAVALAHGLPDIPGFYGCDLATGEFLSYY